MNPWSRVNLVLAVLAAVLLGLQLWPGSGPARATLTALDPAAIRQVRIERADRLEIALERGADGWRLTHPVSAPALARRVEQLLAVARAPVRQAYTTEGGLERYGLARPAAVLQLDALRVAFGDRDPSQQARYTLVDGEVRVIDDLFYNLVTLPVRHFRGG